MPSQAGPRGVTRDVSEAGVYFYTDSWQSHTRHFEFRIVMPAEVTGAESRRALCRATVIRVEDLSISGSSSAPRIGVAALIDEIVWM